MERLPASLTLQVASFGTLIPTGPSTAPKHDVAFVKRISLPSY